MGSKRQRDLSDEQNERLRPIVKRLHETRTQVELAKQIGMSQSTVSGFLSGRQGTSLNVAVKACALAGVPLAEVLGLDLETPHFVTSDLTVGTFLLKLDRLPGLRAWVEANPSKLRLDELARGMVLYELTPPRSREDGQPFGGWDAFFDDALSGRLTKPAKGDIEAAEALERKQLPRATRARLQGTRKKR